MTITLNPEMPFGHDSIEVSLIISSDQIILMADCMSIYGQAISGGLLEDPGDEVQAIFMDLASRLDEAFYNILPDGERAKMEAIEAREVPTDPADNV